MIKKVFRVVALGGLLSFPAWSGAAESQLRAAHLVAGATTAQLTLDVSGNAVLRRVFTLEHPHRAVIDLGHTRAASDLKMPAGAGVVDDIHAARRSGDTLRVVVTLRDALTPRTAWARAGTRGTRKLLVEFGETSARAASASPASAGPGELVGSSGASGSGIAVESRASSGVGPEGGMRGAIRAVRAAHAPAETGRDVVVAVDAGHGGQDPGATGPAGTREKDVVLPIARALAARINAQPGMRAILTRNRDEFLVLRDRIRRARVARADMFISVHADSIANRGISGASVYVLSERGASSETARWLAEGQNAADLMGGVSLDDKGGTLASVLLDLSQSANISASMTAAQRVLAALDGVGQVRKSQVQQAGFVVLKSPDIPSMLVETAYISNPAEELRLRNPRQQAGLAEAIFAGVRSYFEQNPPVGTRFAAERRSAVASVMAGPAP